MKRSILKNLTMTLNYNAVPFEMSRDHSFAYTNYTNGIILSTPKPDWNQMSLASFEKNFYMESPNVSNRSIADIQQFLRDNQISIEGCAPRPISSFDEVPFPEPVMETIGMCGYQKPTLIQSCSWPILLSGLDLIGIALTGSGKTLAFMLPGIIHASHQEFVRPGEGPIVLIMAPTRELAQQISTVAQQFGQLAQCRTTVIFGGASKDPQRQSLLNGVEIVIGTPGRLLDFIEEGALKLDRITYLVLDEADRMLDMGFEPQIRQICERVRSDRQTSMFSATWPKEVRQLASQFLSPNRIHVTIGNVILAANPSICQIIEVCTEEQKQARFLQILHQIIGLRDAKTLVFCQTKRRVDEIYHLTKQIGFPVLCIHGNKQQSQRDFTIGEFRRRRKVILIATDVAARGLDIQDIQFVINIDFPNQTEDYVHRIGRTARSQDVSGTSYTFFTSDNAKQAPSLIRVLQEAGQTINPELLSMAEDQQGSKTRNNYHHQQHQHLNQRRLSVPPPAPVPVNHVHSYPMVPLPYYSQMPSLMQPPMNYVPSLIYQ